jgi:RNA-directed DNA polymerase
MNIKEHISYDLNIPINLIDEALLSARTQVKRFHIPKKNGDKRFILQPSKKLKTLQYWLIHNIFKKLPVHPAAMAYREGISILDNAKRHSQGKYFVKIDLKDFFPSVRFSDLLPIVKKWHVAENPGWALDIEAINLIRLCCFYTGDRLPVGYPSSPAICNFVMYEFDVALSNLISDVPKFGEVVYTRYADDLVFSTSKKGVSKLLIETVSTLIANTTSPLLTINGSKTRIGSSTGGSALVTGLKVCDEGHITIHKKKKDQIRLLLSLYRKNMLKKEEFNSLIGHLSFIHHVDPSFYSKLSLKYFIEIDQLKNQLVISEPEVLLAKIA